MIPHLALTLSFDGIGLSRRTAAGWDIVGHVSLDAPDLADRLRALRDTAAVLCPDGIATTVVLPDEQILNRHLPDVDATPAAVAAALDGLTPYAVADLVFDWRPHRDGGIVVAAVARETLDEAVAFAGQHGFNPVALTAHPAPDLPFAAEPDFGPASSLAGSAPSAPEAVVVDTVLAGPHDAGAAAPDETGGVPGTAVHGAGPDAAGPQTADLQTADLQTADLQTADLQTAEPDPAEAKTSEADTADAESFSTRRVRTQVQPAGLADALDRAADEDPDGAGHNSPPFVLERPVQASDSAPSTDPQDTLARISALPARLTGLGAGLASAAAAPDDGGTDAPLSERPAPEAPAQTGPLAPSIASTEATAAPPEVQPRSPVSSSPLDLPPAPAADASGLLQNAEAPPAVTRLVAATRKGAANGSRPGAAGRPAGTARRGVAVKTGATGTAARAGKSAGTAPLLRAGPEARTSRLAESSPAARAAGASLTVRSLGDPAMDAGGRVAPSMPVVVGLVAALVVALAVAVGLSRVVIGWLAPPTEVATISPDAPMVVPVPDTGQTLSSAVSLDGPRTDPAAAVVDGAPATATNAVAPVEPATAALAVPPTTLVAPEPETLAGSGSASASGPVPAPIPEVNGGSSPGPAAEAADPGPALVADVSDGNAPAGPAPGGEDLARPGPDAVAAPRAAPVRLAAPVAGDALPAIPSQFVLGPGPEPVPDPARPTAVSGSPTADFVRAAYDPALTLQDPLALVPPGPAARTDLPEVQPVPPPDALYRLDPRGLVVATAEGALSPDGHRVILGRPLLVPPVRPLTADPAPAIAADAVTVQRLARLRPPPRPEVSVIPPDAPQGADGATAVPAAPRAVQTTGTTVPVRAPDATTVRPLPRPVALAATVAPADQAATSPRLVNATAQAIPASLRPVSRPAGLDAIAAAASVRIAPLPPPETAAPRDTTPEATAPQDFEYDDGEPETVAAAPRIPSSASVARQATVENALNLRELNLIGVYGTASDRRALVRLPNGRFVKVEIGDRVDGGQVADIGDRDLRYVKGGRSIVLSMPRG